MPIEHLDVSRAVRAASDVFGFRDERSTTASSRYEIKLESVSSLLQTFANLAEPLVGTSKPPKDETAMPVESAAPGRNANTSRVGARPVRQSGQVLPSGRATLPWGDPPRRPLLHSALLMSSLNFIPKATAREFATSSPTLTLPNSIELT